MAAACAVAPCAGCSQTARPSAKLRTFHPVGVWYSVETAAASADALPPPLLATVVDRDFGNIARMDLNTVFIRHYYPDDLPLVLAAAAKYDLRAVVSNPAAIHYVRTGRGGDNPFAAPDRPAAQRSITAHYIGHVVDDLTWQRAGRVVDSARRAHPRLATCATIETAASPRTEKIVLDYPIWCDAPPAGTDNTGAITHIGGLHQVRCLQHRRDELATVRQWLGAYHQGLLRGRTGGVVFDAYRALPGNWQGIVHKDQPPSPERTALLRRIAARARRWARLLEGLRPAPATILGDPPADLRAMLLANDRRRCLMLVNSSPTRFVRTTVVFPSLLGATPISRAVTVSTAEDTTVGAVFHVRHGELRIPLDLPPGEARLFELF